MRRKGRRRPHSKDRGLVLVDLIFNSSEHVRYAEVFDSKAKRVAGGMKHGVRSLEPPREAARIDNATAQFALLLTSQARHYGEFDFMYARMDKFHLFVLPAGGSSILVVTTDPPLGLEFLPRLKALVAEAKM